MAQLPAEEVLVLREECDATNVVQHGNNVRVVDSPSCHPAANLPETNSPLFQRRQLIVGKVLVEKNQATADLELFRTDRRLRRFDPPSHASSASFTASATAARGRRPPQRTLQMKSQERPSATSSSTCQTMMRVPLKVGLPWQITGSATMWRPNSTLTDVRFLPFFMPAIYRCSCAVARRLCPCVLLGYEGADAVQIAVTRERSPPFGALTAATCAPPPTTVHPRSPGHPAWRPPGARRGACPEASGRRGRDGGGF